MNKKVWISVVGTVAVLGAVDYLARGRTAEPSAHPATAQATTAQATAAPAAAPHGIGEGLAKIGLLTRGWLDQVSAVASWDAIGLIVVAALVLTLVLLRRKPVHGHREPWARVVELGREGRSVSSIAQTTRQSQDTVRILLAPIAIERQPAGGNSFRSNDSSPGDSTPAAKTRRRA